MVSFSLSEVAFAFARTFCSGVSSLKGLSSALMVGSAGSALAFGFARALPFEFALAVGDSPTELPDFELEFDDEDGDDEF